MRGAFYLNPCVLIVSLATSSSALAQDWHLSEWTSRAVVQISEPSSETDVDTASVRVLCQGRAKPDGSDYRVIDAAGQEVPFQLTFHDARHSSLISFRAAANQPGPFCVYFGNANAERSKRQIVTPDEPGSGAPHGDWVPRAGLVYSTMQRPDAENPKTVDELKALMAASTEKYGARYQRRVADGHNPFGPSDYFISVYRGWIRIPKDGTWRFCTASNEASFSFLDGKELVHWPGRHTSARGLRGEKNETHELKAGLHYLEYYHEEVLLKQVAFLGWSPPGSETGHFVAIPASTYPAPHQTETVRYETRDGPLASFEPQIVDSIWPDVRNEGQYTRVRFEPANAADFPEGTQFEWDFGDGQTASGARVEHVYLRPERYQVSLKANGTAGDGSASWSLLIYELQHVTGEIKQGRPPEYAEIAAAYDTAKLDADNLLELVRLFSESDRPADTIRAGRSFVERFGQSGSASLPDVHRLIAFSALKTGEQGVDDAIRSFEASITDETSAAAKIDSYAQLIRLLGIEKSEPEKALALLPVVEQTARESSVDEEVKAAYRRAVNASGDTALWNGRRAQARDYYRRVEALRGKYIPLQVRAARIGAYPTSLREHLADGNFGAALNLVNEWEDTFATDKVNGHTFFWRGSILALRKQHREAARYLARAIALAIGAPFETEARWRLAVALEGIGKTKESQAELARLVATGLADDFTDRARRKLKALAEAGSP